MSSLLRLSLLVSALLLLTACRTGIYGPSATTSNAPRVAESRVLLAETFTWVTPEGADRLLDSAERAGFNVIFPCVWGGQGVSWISSLESVRDPRAAKALATGRDPLAELIQKAHARGIEVHPWFKIAARWRNFRAEFYDGGTPERAFNMQSAGFRQYISKLMLEVVERYEVDGINLDYVRTRGNCSSRYCKQQYYRAMGRNLENDLRDMRPRNEAWQSIAKWNGLAVDHVVRMTSEGARRLRPGIIISADSHTQRDHWKIQGADIVWWTNNGWVDVAYNMQYTRAIKRNEVDGAMARMDEPDRMVVLNGNWLPPGPDGGQPRPRPADEVVQAIVDSQRRDRGNGVALYSYKYLSEEQIVALARGPFAVPARPSWPARR